MPPGLTLDTAGRLGRRERPEVHGAVAVCWGSMQYQVALGSEA
jgi:hypothetical protein